MDKIKNIIFDYDGTLHNSMIIYGQGFRQAYKYLVELGYAQERLWDDNEISKWIGFSSKEMWNEFMPELPEDEKKKCSNIIGSYMIQCINENKAELYEGAIDILEYLKEKGFNLIFLSNCKIEYMEAQRRSFNLDNYFKDFYCTEEFGFIPKYDIFHAIKAKYNGNFLVVGDRYQDMEIAKVYNLVFIGCKYGFGKEGELKDSNFLIHDILEIKEIIEEIN